jgi:chaperonin GroEL
LRTSYLAKDLVASKVLEGIKDLADYVAITLGPAGRPVLIEKEPGKVLVTKDGVTTASYFESADPIKNLVATMAREVCERTVRKAGDGPQPLYSKVLTPRGFVQMGDLKIGDEVCGTNGTIQRVVGVFAKGEKEIFELEFANNQIVECSEDHLWTMTDSTNDPKLVTLPVSELINKYERFGKDGYPSRRYYAPKTYVQFDENIAEMPLDPYLVGLLLGDGSLSGTGSIELSLGTKKEHVISKIHLPKGLHLSTAFVDQKNSFRVKINGATADGKSAASVVKSLGLLGTRSDTKFIPKSYLYSSLESRRQLFQGLVDTDGYVNKRGLIEFGSISKELAKDFVELGRSLGRTMSCTLHERKQDDGSYSNTPIYRINELKGYKFGDKLVRVSATGRTTEMMCIKVSNPDNLYITDNYIVTHNTTSAIVLAHALVESGQKFLAANPGYSPQLLARQLAKLFETEIKPSIIAYSKPLTGKDVSSEETARLVKYVATVSANHDEEIAQAVADAIDFVGEDGMVIAEEGAGLTTTVQHQEGFPARAGFHDLGGAATTLFVNRPATSDCILDGAYVAIYDGDILDTSVLIPLLQKVEGEKDEHGFAMKYPIVIVAHNFSPLVLKLLSYNFKKGILFCVPFMSSRNGQAAGKQAFLHDLAAYVSGTVFDPQDKTLQTAIPMQLGFVERAKIGQYDSVFFTEPDQQMVDERIKELKLQMETSSEMDQEKYRYRISQLTGGVATVLAGGATQVEAKERLDRVHDAISAVRSALDSGVIPGGGSVLAKIGASLSGKESTDPLSVFAKALQKPFTQILDNAGYLVGDGTYSSYLDQIGPSKDGTFQVINAISNQAVDWQESGIMDPTKVTLSALEAALSVAQLLMTLGGITVNQVSDGEKQIQVMQEGLIRAAQGEL